MGLPPKEDKTLGSSPAMRLPLPAARIIKSIVIYTKMRQKNDPKVRKGGLLNYFLRSFCKAFNLAAASARLAAAIE